PFEHVSRAGGASSRRCQDSRGGEPAILCFIAEGLQGDLLPPHSEKKGTRHGRSRQALRFRRHNTRTARRGRNEDRRSGRFLREGPVAPFLPETGGKGTEIRDRRSSRNQAPLL